MELGKLIEKLTKLKEDIGEDNIQVYVEVNRQQAKNGNYEFSIHHHYHEANVYNGIQQKEINEIILMPEADGFQDITDRIPAFIGISFPVCFAEEEDAEQYEGVKKFIKKKGSDWFRVTFMVDLETHKILDWDDKCYGAQIYEKVVDSGTYTLYDKTLQTIASIDGYVPNKVLPPEDGYSDYLELHINKDGVITNWYDKPDFSEIFEGDDYDDDDDDDDDN